MSTKELTELFGKPITPKQQMIVVGERVFVRESPTEWRECSGTPYRPSTRPDEN